jgi:hypothetical protein
MADLAAPNPGNYTFGAHEIIIDPSGTPISLGNVVNASVNVEFTELSHFSARTGEEVEDANILRQMRFTIEATLDEPNKKNVFYFLMADATGKVGMAAQTPKVVKFSGIPVVGNAFDWTIPKVMIRPNGSFGYNSQDWTQFSLTLKVIYDASAPTAPFGTITHTGV